MGYRKYKTEEFIERCRLKHGEKYDYSKTIFTAAKDKVIIICPVHGEFKQDAYTHMIGAGCNICATERMADKCRYSQDEIILICKNIWGDRFDYSELIYTGILNKHEIKCNICGSKFTQCLSMHIHRKIDGCPKCSQGRGWRRSTWVDFCNKNKKADPRVYISRLFNDGEEFIKIGITSVKMRERFNSIPYEYEVIKEIHGSPAFIFDKELELHKIFKEYKIIPKIWFKGSTECFSLDILPLVKSL